MRKFFKILLYVLGSIILLILIAVVYLQTPSGKEMVRKQAVKFLQNKLKTEVAIKKIDYSLPKWLELQGVLFIDKNKDTLLTVNKLRVDMKMLALINSKVLINKLELDGLYANVYRNAPDTNFNYQYIIDAFASPPDSTNHAKTEDTSASSLVLNVKRIELNNIRILYNDQSGGTFFHVDLKNLLLRPRNIDLNNLAFDVKEFAVNGLHSSFATDTAFIAPTPDTSTAPPKFRLTVDKLDLKDIGFTFDARQDSLHFDAMVGSLGGKLDSFNLATERVAINSLQLENTSARFIIGKSKKQAITPEIPADSASPSNWMITAGNLMTKQVNFAMDNNNSPRLSQGIDYSHLNIQNFSLNAENAYYTADSTSANLKHLALNEKSGLSIVEMRTQFAYFGRGATLSNLYIQTPGTTIQDHIEVAYASLESLQKDLGKMQLNIALHDSKVAVNDVMIFMPAGQRKMLQPYTGQQVKIAGDIKGALENLSLQSINIEGLRNTQIALSGNIVGLPDADKLRYDLQIAKVYSTYQDVAPFLPDSLKKQISIPAWFSVAGHIAGTTQDFYPQLTINTADGDAKVAGSVLLSPGTNHEKYDLAFATNNLNIGKILRQDSLIGKVTMNGNAKGTSFDINTMSASVNGSVQSLWFKGYTYQDVNLAADIAQKKAKIKLNSQDPNAALLADATLDLNGANPAVQAVVDIQELNPFALKLYGDTLQLKGKMFIDFSDLNARFPVGSFVWENPQINLSNHFFDLDSVYLQSQPTADSSQNIVFNLSNIFSGTLTGHIPLTDIGNAALAHINKYYRLSDTITDAPLQYDMELNAMVKNHPAVKEFLPSLNNFQYFSLKAKIYPDTFLVNGFTPRVGIDDNILDSVHLLVEEGNALMNYNVGAHRFRSGSSIELWKPTVSGYLQNDSLIANASVSDSAMEEQFALGARAYHPDSNTYFHLFPGLKFDYNIWNVNPENQIAFGPQGFYINNFDMQKGSESIAVNSATPSAYASPLNLEIKNFSLSNITSMISKGDTLIADGKLNLKGQVDLSDTFAKVNTQLTVDSLAFMNRVLGNLSATASNTNANTYEAIVKLTDRGNNLSLNGKYNIEPVNGNNFDFLLNIDPISLASVEGLAMNSIKNSAGYVRGKLDIKGIVEKPIINGALQTDSLYTTISMFNTPLLMKNETITFNDAGIQFNNFKLIDTNQQEAVINGSVKTSDYRNFFLGLKVITDSFMVMNSTAKDNESLYGRLFLSSNLNLTGAATAPVITGNLRIHDSTKAYFAMVDAAPQVEDDEGIVKFVNGKDTTQNYYAIDSATLKSGFVTGSGANINVNVDIDKYANFNVIVDPNTGDNLSVSGEAALNTVVGADGTVGLTGVYALDKGYYELHYALLKRKFEIQSGSTITLAGDPLNALADITAVYNTKTPPYDLVEKQVSDPNQLVYFKQRLPFQVQMKIQGKVMQPVITFDIVLPEDQAGSVSSDVSNLVQSKLTSIRNNPSEINKQVFALLILGRFIADDPFQTGAGSSTESIVRQSAARLLSQQLNQIADQLVKGLDLSLDLGSEEDYSTGQKVNRTDLNVSASKRLFNDRLTLTVGNDFQLEGQPVQNRQSSFIPGTLSADYRLTPDGRYLVRAYRNSQLQNIIDGYVTETGVSFRLSMEYNRFRQIFQNRKKLQRIRKERREQEERELQQKAEESKVGME